MRNSILLLFVAACSCRTAPRFEHTTATGVARANNVDDARGIAHTSELLAHRVTSILGVPPEPKFVVYYDDRAEGYEGQLRVWRDSNGQITSRRVELGADSRRGLHYILAHELVHHYATGPWERLPHTIEEGLADCIALQIAPEFRAERLAFYAERSEGMSEAEARDLLALTSADRDKFSEATRRGMYTVGFRVVEQLGIDGLRRLCERAEREDEPTIPLDWILAVVKLPPDVATPPLTGSDPAR